MDKIVNIYPTWPITRLNPPIRSVVKNVTKSVEDIRVCLVSRAKVEEVLPDGSTVALSFNNYNKDNSIKITKTEETIITDNDTTSVAPDTAEQAVEIAVEEKVEAVDEQSKPTEQRFGKHNKKHHNRYNNKPDADGSDNNGTDSVAEATVSADDEVAVETIDIESIL